MKTALLFAAGLLLCASPVAAATPNAVSPAPSPVADLPKPAITTGPSVITVGSVTCPVVPAASLTPDAVRQQFAIIADACLMRATGAIDDSQYQTIRDMAVNSIYVELQAEENDRQTKALAMK